MKRLFYAALAAALTAAVAAPVLARQPAPRAITVNGQPIPERRIDALVKQQVARGRKDSSQLRHAIVNNLINIELVVQAAEKKGLTKNPDLREQIEMAREQAIVNAYLADYFKAHPISDATLHATYDRIKARRGNKEYKARHVLVGSEAEAKKIIAKLNKGAKLQEFAKESKDVGTRNRGGELGWAPASNYVKPFADALVKLKKGAYTREPVKSQFGWHVIQLEDVRPAHFPPFEQVKRQLNQVVEREEVQKVFKALRAKAKITD